MKTIILMRHAKSSWDDPTHTDKQRPLNSRGRDACRVAGRWLAGNHGRPGHIFVSAARRTLETWKGIAPFLPKTSTDGDPVVKDALYMAGPDVMIDILKTAPDAAASVLMIAHQPGTGALVQLLSGADICPGCKRAFSHFPTAAVAVLEADIDRWSDLNFGMAAFRTFTGPKDMQKPPDA